VLGDRFHSRALATPTEVHYALTYVLNNARKHGILGDGPDPFSSGPEFDGWTPESVAAIWRGRGERSRPRIGVPTKAAKTWLLSVGWRRRGLLDWREIPGGKAAKRARSKEEARAADSIRRSLAAAARGSRHRPMEVGAPSPKPRGAAHRERGSHGRDWRATHRSSQI
jgi:hypothetical protein